MGEEHNARNDGAWMSKAATDALASGIARGVALRGRRWRAGLRAGVRRQ